MIWTQQHGQWKEVPLHNSMAGLSAFIVCNGPSLEKVDVSRLRGPGRVVIAVNNAAPHVSADWWVGMDTPECYDRSIFATPVPKLVRREHWKAYEKFPAIHTVDMAENIAFYDGGERDFFRWDADSFRMALQFVIHLGCRDVVLCGVDLSTARGDYADWPKLLSDEQRASNERLYGHTLKFLAWHLQSRPAVRFVSASPGSKLNGFMPHEPLKRIVRSLEQTVPKGRKFKHVLEESNSP